MASSYTLLANLRAGRCSNTAEVRLLRSWEARNINKGGELISVDMLFIDENSTMVQGSIPALRQLQFKNRLAEGSIYTLTGFDVVRSNPMFRLSDSTFSIHFNEGTELEKLSTTVRTIPTELFRFRTYDQLRELANTGKQLPDIMGELCQIRSTITDRIPGAQRVMLSLRLESGTVVCVSLFDSLAPAFHSKLDSYVREPKIVLVTGVNPKIVAGKLYLNGTSATRVFFDSETAVGKDAFDRLPSDGTDQSASSSKVVHTQKIEPMKISDLNQFVITADPQVVEFLCTAKLTEIQVAEGWCYIGCSVCSKKLIREETSFTCAPCNETNAVAQLRYRVILSVSDETGIAAFLGFDTEITKLTNVLAAEAAQIVGVGLNAQVDTDLPRVLSELVGKTYTFQLKLKDFNFTAHHQTFTISRIFPARDLAPLLTFAENVEVHEQAHLQNVAPGTDDRAAITSDVAEVSTAGDGTLTGREAEANEHDAAEDNASKKARVE
ncbi:probable replication factor A 73 kDa subunit [Brassica napus]|uniref:probable replication factor A 73 kDa subunit n=1 Tax=Brassica napus TaxID=3708 RepID=UPI0006AB01FD|nr:probable replication factor A 73 kDa subunit [Brassica napus]